MILIIFGLLCFGFFFYLQESFSEKELEPTESTPSEWKYMIDFNKEWDDFEKENSRLSSRKKTLYWYCKAPQHQKETIAAFHDIKPEELGSSSSEQVLAPAIRAAKGREKREAIKYLRVRFAEILESKKQEASATSPSVQPLSNSDRQAIVDQYGNSQTTKKFEDFVAKKIDYLNWMG